MIRGAAFDGGIAERDCRLVFRHALIKGDCAVGLAVGHFAELREDEMLALAGLR